MKKRPWKCITLISILLCFHFFGYIVPLIKHNLNGNSSISNCESVLAALPHPIFDGLYINYSCSWLGIGYSLWNASYSHVSGTIFHVSGIENGTASWDVDVQTRTLYNASYYFSGMHTPLWIFPNVTLGDAVLMQVTEFGDDHIFEVVDKFLYNLSNYGPVEVWRLDDRGKSGCYALYETSTGFLIKSIFREYGWAGSFIYVCLDLLTTNAELNRTVPSTPRNLHAIPGNQEISLTWQVPSKEGNSSITNYKIYRGTSPGTESLLTTIGNELAYKDTNLTNGHKHYYRVSALNADGESFLSEEVSATPATVPNPPQNLRATIINGKLVISWDAPANTGGASIIGYNVYRGTSPSNLSLLVTTSNISSFTDTNLTNGRVYYYRISAVNMIGEGSLSDEVMAMGCILGGNAQDIILIIILFLITGVVGVSGYVIRIKRKRSHMERKIMGLSKAPTGEKASKSWKFVSSELGLHTIENEDRLGVFKRIRSNLSESEAEFLWISLMLRFNRMYKLENWDQTLIILRKLFKLAEFQGNYEKLNDLSLKYEAIPKQKQKI